MSEFAACHSVSELLSRTRNHVRPLIEAYWQRSHGAIPAVAMTEKGEYTEEFQHFHDYRRALEQYAQRVALLPVLDDGKVNPATHADDLQLLRSRIEAMPAHMRLGEDIIHSVEQAARGCTVQVPPLAQPAMGVTLLMGKRFALQPALDRVAQQVQQQVASFWPLGEKPLDRALFVSQAQDYAQHYALAQLIGNAQLRTAYQASLEGEYTSLREMSFSHFSKDTQRHIAGEALRSLQRAVEAELSRSMGQGV